MKRMSLSSHVNFAVVFRVVGWLLLIEAAFMAIPMTMAFVTESCDATAFLISAIVTLVVGMLLTGIRPSRKDIGRREGFLLTALVWIVYSLFGMLPFVLSPLLRLGIVDAFFEAISGFTTTGLSDLDCNTLSQPILLWRSLSQWIGGMGIILFTLAVLPMLNHSGGMQMFTAEVTGITKEKLRPRVSQTAKGLWRVYIVLTVMLFVLLCIGPMSVFDSVCHALSTMATGGLSTRTLGIESWDSLYVKVVITVFMFIGGVNFALLFRVCSGQYKALRANEIFKAYIVVILVMYAGFVISILQSGAYRGWQSVTIDPLFQVVSVISSTGYTLSSVPMWGALVTFLILLMMFSGASAGSTSGGAKIDRLYVLFKQIFNDIRSLLRPNAYMTVRLNGKTMTQDVVTRVMAFLALYAIVIICSAMILSLLGMSVHSAIYCSLECISNAGLGNIEMNADYTDIYANPLTKIVMSLVMVVGRLELFTMLVLFTPGFWRR